MAVEDELTILIPADVQEDVVRFLAGRDVLEVRDFRSPHSRRDVVEVVLLYQALYLGGYHGPTRELVISKQNQANIDRMMQQGRTTVMANSAWVDDISKESENIWVTDALVKAGDLSVGFYANSANASALSKKLIEQRDTVSAVSTKHWRVDWTALQELGFKELHDGAAWPRMVKMVTDGSADVLLAPFKTPVDTGINFNGNSLSVVPFVKLTLPGSRHWIISKYNPMGEVGFLSLQHGLSELKKMKRVELAYRQSGFINDEVKDWVELKQP